MHTADNIRKMIEFLIDNIFVQFLGRLFHQMTGIPMGTNCAPLLADLSLYSYDDFRYHHTMISDIATSAWLMDFCQRL